VVSSLSSFPFACLIHCIAQVKPLGFRYSAAEASSREHF